MLIRDALPSPPAPSSSAALPAAANSNVRSARGGMSTSMARYLMACRVDEALRLLDDAALDALVVDEVAFAAAPARLATHLCGPDPDLRGTVLRIVY